MYKTVSFVIIFLIFLLQACSSIKSVLMESVVEGVNLEKNIAFLEEDDPELMGEAFPSIIKFSEMLMYQSPENKELVVSTIRALTIYSNKWLEWKSKVVEEEIDRVTLEKLTNSVKKDFNNIISIKSDLEKGVMPNLIGMKLRDVLPVLENYNLKVEFKGAGKVIFQSVNQGESIDKQEVIKIKLS